ncbi:MAG: LysR family transcriptional regulator [Rhizobiales bacterium]|nr:LysR family transcriptional regulator [Hyphomicrobiales bacterium]
MNEIDDMRAFVEVVESGGFSRAAKRLGVSKSIVSRRIARLEDQLGARLLSRTTRGISPTEAGTDFKARSERILAELDEAREAMAHHRGDVVGRLRVAAPMGFGGRHVAPLLAMLAERHPRLEVDLALSDRRVDLVAEGFDAAVRIGTPEDSTLVARRITAVHAVLVASPDYIAEHGQPQLPEDLARHECLIYTGTSTADWVFSAGRRTVSVRPRGRLRADSGEAILEWAIAGRGIAALPAFLLSDAIERHSLVPVLRDYAMPEGAIYVLRPPGANVPGKVRALIDAMVERFGGEPHWDRCMMAAHRAAEAEPPLAAA